MNELVFDEPERLARDAPPRARAIPDYAAIGDGNTSALIDRSGSMDWLCWPRFDSDAIFAAMIGHDGNGVWAIAPEAPFRSSRQYRDDTLILETRFETEGGAALLTDFMPYQVGSQAVIRRLRGLSGAMRMTMRFAPRFLNGSVAPRYARKCGGLIASCKAASLVLRATRPELAQAEETASFDLAESETIDFILSDKNASPVELPAYIATAEAACEAFWRAWISKCSYDGPWRRAVARSLITLKALIYAPSGGIVAAPTTSLPERVGGSRNWDYRYCWLRDSTFAVLAFLHTGYLEEADAWVNWSLRAADPRTARTHVFYGVVPNTEIDEYEAHWLAGFNGSRPVRFGNDARTQLQLGVYGEVQDTLYQWRLASGGAECRGWAQQCTMLSRLVPVMGEPDAGIWEQRGHLERFTQSRALAWVAFDRALETADRFGFAKDPAWVSHRDALRAEVCEKGFDATIGAFSRAYGSQSVDASCLLLPMVGFLPADDPRIVGTVRAIRSRLSAGPFVYRYDARLEDDGVGGSEGAFLPCSFWLADNLILQRREDEAAAIFESVVGSANDVGLLSEEYDVSGKLLLGNFPQALTYLSLVHTALNLAGAGPAHHRGRGAY
ncbi:MAG: glycoside hydrolase family 15 protein [Roseiarcus sp.]